MMQLKFDVLVKELKTVNDIPEIWADEQYRMLLREVEFDDIDDINAEDLKDMAVMSLQDLKPDEAAVNVLAVWAGGLTAGVRRNLANEMQEEPMWEEYADPTYHAAIFAAAVLLNQAFPKIYKRPEIARLVLNVTATNTAAAKLLSAPTPALVARLIAGGMDEHSVLRRLYTDQLASGMFAEADSIIWQTQVANQSEETANWVIYSSWYWLRPLQSGRNYVATIVGE